MNPVLLHLAGRHLRQAKLSEEGAQVNADAGLVAFGPALAALAFRDDLVFLLELVGGLAERLLFLEKASARFPAQRQIPVLGELLRLRQLLFLRGGAVLTAVSRRGAMPELAASLIDLNQAAQDFVTDDVRISRTPCVR